MAARGVLLTITGIVAVSVGLGSTANAQSTEPSSLAPQPLEAIILEAPSAENIPSDEAGGQSEEGGTWAPPTEPSTMIGSGGTSIEVNVLQTLGADMAGTLNADNGGFEPLIWRGTPRSTVDRLLLTLPVHTTSRAMRDLMRRILLTQAIPPEGAGDDGGYISRRLELLAEMGDMNSAEELLAITPGRGTNERFVRTETDIHLLHGDFVDACALASGPVGQGTDEFWQKLLVFCDVLSGENAKAQLGLSLLREVGVEDIRYYRMLDAMMASEVPVVEDLLSLSSLHLGIIRASRARLSPETPVVLPPVVLSVMVSNPDMDMRERLAAAELATGKGVFSIENLRALYAGITFEEDALAHPLTAAETLQDAEARALLYQVVSRQTVDGARAEAAALALESADSVGLYTTTAEVFNEIIKQVPPRTDLIWFAGHAVRSLIAAGDSEAISGWLGLLRINSSLSDDAAVTLARLVPLVWLTGLDDAEHPATTTASVWQEGDGSGQTIRDRAVLFYSLLESLGQPVDPPVWDSLGYVSQLDGQEQDGSGKAYVLPDPVLWHRLSRAAKSGKTGETILLALATLGAGGTASAHPVTISHVLQSLNMVGLGDAARVLAVEAALMGGL